MLGCIRRNLWTQDDETPWNMISGNAYLRIVATPTTVVTPIGVMGVWMYDRTTIIFRGGPTRDWWYVDGLLNWALTQAYSGYTLPPYHYILNEDKGHIYAQKVPVAAYCRENFQKIAGNQIKLATNDPPGRLAKNSIHGYSTCKYCSVKRRCDTLDQQTPGGKDDWGPSYPYP